MTSMTLGLSILAGFAAAVAILWLLPRVLTQATEATWRARGAWARLRRGPIPRDSEGSYVSRDGEPYQIETAPIAGSDRLVGLTLRHLYRPAIPGTHLPELFLAVPADALLLEAGIRALLDRADQLSRRFVQAAAGADLAWDTEPPEPVIPPELQEAIEDTHRMVAEATALPAEDREGEV